MLRANSPSRDESSQEFASMIIVNIGRWRETIVINLQTIHVPSSSPVGSVPERLSR